MIARTAGKVIKTVESRQKRQNKYTNCTQLNPTKLQNAYCCDDQNMK